MKVMADSRNRRHINFRCKQHCFTCHCLCTQHRNNKEDGVHRWLVLASSCGAMVLDLGLMFSIGSLFLPIMEKFGSDRANTATVQSTMVAIAMCCGKTHGRIFLIAHFTK